MKPTKLLLMILLIISAVFCLACGRKKPPVAAEYKNHTFEITYHG